MASRKLIGEILVEMGCLTPERLKEALEQKGNSPSRIGAFLVKEGLARPCDITRALAQQFDYPMVELSYLDPPEDFENIINVEMAKELRVLPIFQSNGRLVVAVADPVNLDVLDRLRFKVGGDVQFALASIQNLEQAIRRFYGLGDDIGLDDIEDKDIEINVGVEESNEDGVRDSAVIKMVHHLISEGVRRRASDIHVEPMRDRVRVRYRIDGICYDVQSLPKNLQPSVIARIKIMSRMDIAEKRKPQDGRIKLKIFGREVDFRVSALPAIQGESVVLRILDKGSVMLGVEQLGFHAGDYAVFKKLITRPNGIVLVTGPTGSGKTTTLYAALNELNSSVRKIITAENPVEYNISGLNQCEVNEKAGLTFVRILRAMLRQAPNVILVGEIRDLETAEIAVQASLTGHLVFSTLHTNDAPSAITRLTDLGVKPFLVASSLFAVLAQRLVRQICKDCKQPYSPDPQKLAYCGIDPRDIEEKVFYHGSGCATCNNIGYKSRTGIYEMMVMSPQLRDMAYQITPTDEIRRQAIREGMKTLIADGARKILAGVTTVEEVVREAKSIT